ncbi:MAG: DUF1761 domain-containing protein [Sphingomicrobium sp.]
MRAGGINWLAVLVSAVVIYAIGFVIYGVLVPAEYLMSASGISQEQMEAVGATRMPFGVVMPLMTAAFLAILFKLGRVVDAATGAKWAAVVALATAIPAVLYGWVYGVGPFDMTLIDSGHLLLGHVAAGTILGAWR